MKNVLIVDDSSVVRRAIRFLLQETHKLAICSEAEDGAQGIATAEALKPDLIILDLAMPKLNGAEAAPVLKRILPGVPIILFTMYEKASVIGVDMVLSKSDGFSDLARCVQDLLYPSQNQAPV